MALARIPENENEEDLIRIETHIQNAYTIEGETILFQAKITGEEPTCVWYFNGQEVKRNPRYRSSTRGSWRQFQIKKVRRSDVGIYTLVCSNEYSYAETQALLIVTNRRPVEINDKKPHLTLYLKMPSTRLKIDKHLRNLRINKGDTIKLSISVEKSRHFRPDYVWLRNNRLCIFDDGVQSTSKECDSAEYIKFDADEGDSGFYVVLVKYFDIILSSSAEVIVINKENSDSEIPITNSGSPCFYNYLPEELEVFEEDEINLQCKVDTCHDINWLKDMSRIDASENIVMQRLERGIALKVLKPTLQDSGIYTVVVTNEEGNHITAQCIVTVNLRPHIEIPEVTVQHPLEVVLTSVGTKVCLYCKFNGPKNDLLFAVWRVGLFTIERSSSLFVVETSQTGMNVLLIRNVDPDMLGDISCELRYMLPSKRSVPVVITKGLLVNVPVDTLSDESLKEGRILTKKVATDMLFEKTTVMHTAAVAIPGSNFSDEESTDEESKQDEAAAYPLEVSDGRSGSRSRTYSLEDSESDDDTLIDLPTSLSSNTLVPSSPKEIEIKPEDKTEESSKTVVELEEELMEFVYCKFGEDQSHFVKIQSCRRRKLLITVETKQESRGGIKNAVHIAWVTKKQLPEGSLYAVDLLQPSGEYFRAGETSEPLLVIKESNAHKLMLFRVRTIRTTEKNPIAHFIICPPGLNVILPEMLPRRPADEFAKSFTRIGIIGTGAYGSVYLVRNRDGTHYAAKTIKTRTEKRRKVTQREMNIMENLQHKRIVKLYEAYVSREQCILVMEYLWGGELLDRIVEEENFKESTAVHYVRQICEGLEYLHRHNIVHLDIKPENVVCISPNSCDIKIVDFGLSRDLNKGVVRAIYGTKDYVAPEILSFDALGPASDMWSLGVVTYVMLSGTVPFVGFHWPERAANITRGAYDYSEPAFDNVTDEARDFIDSLLRVDPERRLTAVTARLHPWMVGNLDQEFGPGQTKRWRLNLKTYLETNKDRWQRAGNVVIAANRLLIGAHREGIPKVFDK